MVSKGQIHRKEGEKIQNQKIFFGILDEESRNDRWNKKDVYRNETN